MTTGKTIALTRQTFFGKAMSTHCPPLSPGVCSNSCSLSQWCYSTISSSVTLSSSCLQSFLASGSFPMSWLFISGGQSIGASASASVFSGKEQLWKVEGRTDKCPKTGVCGTCGNWVRLELLGRGERERGQLEAGGVSRGQEHQGTLSR